MGQPHMLAVAIAQRWDVVLFADLLAQATEMLRLVVVTFIAVFAYMCAAGLFIAIFSSVLRRGGVK